MCEIKHVFLTESGANSQALLGSVKTDFILNPNIKLSGKQSKIVNPSQVIM